MADSLNIVISVAAILMAIINMLFGFILKRTWSELADNRKELKEIYALLADIRVSLARMEERGKVVVREN